MKHAFATTCKKRPNFPNQFCTPRKLERVAVSATPILDANRIFTIKEAIGKAFGSGLTEKFWFHDIDITLDEASVARIAIADEAMQSAARRRADFRDSAIDIGQAASGPLSAKR